MVMVFAQTEELQVNCDASRQLRALPLHRQTPTGHLIPTAPEVDICTAEGRTDTAGCTHLRRRPCGREFGRGDGYGYYGGGGGGTLCRVTEVP